MKAKKFLIIGLLLTLVLSFSACKKSAKPVEVPDSQPEVTNEETQEAPKTNKSYDSLEEYFKANPSDMEALQKTAESNQMGIDVEDNSIIFSYDIKQISSEIKEEQAMSDATKKLFEEALASQDNSFKSLCTSIEEGANVKNVNLIVRYTYGDKVVVEKTYTSN